MKAIERKDLVVGVEYTLDRGRRNKAHFVGRDETKYALFFMSQERTNYFEDEEGFIRFPLTGNPFFLEEDI